MNVESVLNKIKLFEELVLQSGMKRDAVDYYRAIQEGHNRTLVFMKDLSSRLKEFFYEFENNSLGSELELILKEDSPFLDENYLDQLNEIDADVELEANGYFQKFNALLKKLNASIQSNEDELMLVKDMFSKYTSSIDTEIAKGDQALISIVFKDLESTGSLKEFSKVLNRWNRTLLIYHTLLKSESPDEISLVEIQNGSIDVIFNFDFDVSLDLVELIELGLKVYAGYLLYKSKRAREIIDSYMGNKKLIKSEEEREKLMLDNIKDSMTEKAISQHKEKLKSDKKIDKTGVDKKAEQVSELLADHIIKGNEVKLLTPPESVKQEGEEDEEKEKDLSTTLREETAKVRELFKKLPEEERQLLIDMYSIKDEDDE